MAPTRWQSRFFTIWSGQAVSLFGSALVQFALIWWLTATTGSALTLALATLTGMLPQILLGPFIGVLVDRWSRRWLMVASDTLVAVSTLVLAGLFWTGLAEVWHVYVVLFIRSLASTVQFPAMQASTSLMVPEQHLARIAGLNQMLQGLMGIVAPPVGALLLAVLPLGGVLLIDVGTALLGILPMALIGVPQPAGQPGQAERPSVSGELRSGLAYVWAWTGLLLVIALAALLNMLMVPAGALQPLLVTSHFGGGPLQLAAIQSAFSIGIIAGGILLGVWGGFHRRILTSLMGIAGLGVALLVLGLLPTGGFLAALACMGVAGAMIPIANGPLLAVMQSVVAPAMQGRVFTLVNSVATAMSPIGLLIGTPVAMALGVQAWYVIGGLACTVLGIAACFVPAIMQLEQYRATEQETAVTLASVAD